MDFDWQKLLDDIGNGAIEFAKSYGPKILAAIAVYLIGKWVAKIIRGTLRRVLAKAKMDATLSTFLVNIAYAVLMVFVILAALGQLGIQTTSLVALIGAAGLAVAFALQGSLANFAAGVMIIVFRPFKIGDYVEGAGTAGTVENISIFSTILKTPDNKKIIVPNSSVTGGNITNFSANPTRRVDMVFGCAYEDDLRKAKELLQRIVKEHPLVLEDPAPVVVVGALADSSVNFNVRPWCKTPDYWTVYGEVTEAVKLAFDENGISIPFPQREVHLHTVPADAA